MFFFAFTKFTLMIENRNLRFSAVAAAVVWSPNLCARKRVRKLGAGINLGGVRDLNRVGAVVGEREEHVIYLLY